MPDAKLDAKELKKLVALAKTKPLAFAFCPGPRDDHLFLIDKKKKPKQLLLIAKQEGPGKKVAFGTCMVVDKEMQLTCEKILPKMARTIKKYLKEQKIPLGVLILDASGAVQDREEEVPQEEAGDASASAAASQTTDDDAKARAAELVTRIKALLGDIAAMSQGHADKLNKVKARAVAQIKGGDLQGAQSTISAMEGAISKYAQAKASHAAAESGTQDKAAQEDAKETTAQTPETDTDRLTGAVDALGDAVAKLGGPAGEKLTAALGNVAKMIASGNLKAAETLLSRIETATARETEKNAAKDKGAASAQADKWSSVKARLQPLIDKLMQEGRGDLAAINRVFNYALEQAEAGNFDKALSAATRAVELVKKAGDSPGAVSEAEQAIPDNIVAYTKTRLSWIKSRAGMRKELEGLKSAIDKATAGIEGLEQVPAKSGGIFSYIDEIDGDLEDTLDRLVNAGDADARAALKSAAGKIIDQYSGVLESPFFQAVGDNGFTKTNIRAGAIKSLQEVRAALEN